MKRPSKRELYLELAQPNRNGFSRKVHVREFRGKYKRLQMGNGGDWCRDDGTLAKQYNIERGKQGNRIEYIRLHGKKKQAIEKPIPNRIRRHFRGKRCVVLGVAGIEIDHRDGRRDDPRLSDAARVKVSDFQPLSKAANNAKRQCCKECRKTDKRFDARTLGFKQAQIEGNGTYRGSCVGCYWYDPKRFHGATGI